MLVDHATIRVRSGRGGDGSNSLHREKFVPKGGPDGGDGGKGGDVILVGDPHLDTLAGFVRRRLLAAEDGEPGRKNECYGRAGEDLMVPLPLGCQVFDEDDGALVVDLTEAGQRDRPHGYGYAVTFHYVKSQAMSTASPEQHYTALWQISRAAAAPAKTRPAGGRAYQLPGWYTSARTRRRPN